MHENLLKAQLHTYEQNIETCCTVTFQMMEHWVKIFFKITKDWFYMDSQKYAYNFL